MIRRMITQGVPLCAIFPVGILPTFNSDILSGESETEKKADFSVLKQETGWDRVKRVFQTDEFGTVSLELNTITQAGCMSMFVGALYGGIMNSRTSYMDFMRNNQATAFKDHIDAKRQLHDAIVKSFAKGAFRWGWRLTLFTTTFVGVATVINAYRGKSGFVEYISAGTLAGFLYKFKEGPRSWVVGAGLGAVLGTIAGGATLAILHLTGLSMEQARYWQHHWYDQRNLQLKKSIDEYLNKDDLEVIKAHNEKVLGVGDDIIKVERTESSSKLPDSLNN